MQLFVNDLTVMDFSYLCERRGMVGESWLVDVILHGNLNEESMVLDFSKVKRTLKYLIDEYVDHKLLVPADSPATTILRGGDDDNVSVDFARDDARGIYLNCPAEAYAFIYAKAVTQASVKQYLKELIRTHMPENVNDIELMLRTEVINAPYYHYTHGLKKHDGNCQRIAHGHRSRINMYQDGVLCEAWQAYWAQRWKDIYIGTREDVVSLSELQLSSSAMRQNLSQHLLFSYESSQGRFDLAIPQAESELIDTDSTVECLAQYIADEQKRLAPKAAIKVMAFEGVGKGAIAYA